MGLIEKYNNYLKNENSKDEIANTQQKLPKELQHSIEPMQLTPSIRTVIHEFVALLPDYLWQIFPGNATPQLRLSKEESSLYKSISYAIYSDVPLEWYSQVLDDNSRVKSTFIQYFDSKPIYKNQSMEHYRSEREKNKINKKIDEAFRAANMVEQTPFLTFKKTYCPLLEHYAGNLSQNFVRLTYFCDDVLDEVGYLVIFKDENVYDWTVRICQSTHEQEYIHHLGRLKNHPLRTKETAEEFFLEKLKRMEFLPQPESLMDGLCPNW